MMTKTSNDGLGNRRKRIALGDKRKLERGKERQTEGRTVAYYLTTPIAFQTVVIKQHKDWLPCTATTPIRQCARLRPLCSPGLCLAAHFHHPLCVSERTATVSVSISPDLITVLIGF